MATPDQIDYALNTLLSAYLRLPFEFTCTDLMLIRRKKTGSAAVNAEMQKI